MRPGPQHRKATTPDSIIGVMILALFICGWSAPAQAVGIGPYFDFSSGSGDFEWDRSGSEFDVDASTAAIGLVIDTAPTTESGFNYRLNIGFERQDLEDNTNLSLELSGLTVENVFGFALVRRPDLRWWIGPLVRFGFYSGETEDYYDSWGDRYRTEADFFEFGVGMVTGVNIRVNRTLVLAPSAGVRFIGASGEGTKINYSAGTRAKEDLDGNFSTVFFNFALLFN